MTKTSRIRRGEAYDRIAKILDDLDDDEAESVMRVFGYKKVRLGGGIK